MFKAQKKITGHTGKEFSEHVSKHHYDIKSSSGNNELVQYLTNRFADWKI